MRRIASAVCNVEKRVFNRKLLADNWDEFCSVFEGFPDLLEIENELLNLDGPARSDKDYLCKNSIQNFVNFYSTNHRPLQNLQQQDQLVYAAYDYADQHQSPLQRQAPIYQSHELNHDTQYHLEPQPISTTDQSLFDTERVILKDFFDDRTETEQAPNHQLHQDYQNVSIQNRLTAPTSNQHQFDSSPHTYKTTHRNHSPYKSLFPTDPQALAMLRERSSTPVKKSPLPSAQKPVEHTFIRQPSPDSRFRSNDTSMQQSPGNGGIAKKKRKYVNRVEVHHQTMKMKDKENSFVEKVPITFQSSGKDASASGLSDHRHFRGY